MTACFDKKSNFCSPIFLHGQFRCGSTFVFNRFRSSDQFYTYYEPLHHDLIKIRKNKIDLWGFDSKTTRKVSHPGLSRPHFFEYQKCFRQGQSRLPFFQKSFSYDQFYNVTDEDFFNYIDHLLSSAPEGKRPVLQFNRTSLRIDWFAKRFRGINAALIRNPRDQFESYVATSNGIFLIMNLIILTRHSSENPFAHLTREMMIPTYTSESITEEIKFYKAIYKKVPLHHHYRIFLSIWYKAYLHSDEHADIVINMNRIASDDDYRLLCEDVMQFDSLFEGYALRAGRRYCLGDRHLDEVERSVFAECAPELADKIRSEYNLEPKANNRGFTNIEKARNIIAMVSPLSYLSRAREKEGNIPIISIITPSFNQAEFIAQTIRSVLTQKGRFYIDYVVMDGSSTDNSLSIIENMRNRYIHGEHTEIDGLRYYRNSQCKCAGISYRVISERDAGQSDAINKGFSLAKGDIMAWLNSDDIYYSDETLSQIVAIFKDRNIKFIYGRGIRIDRYGMFIKEEVYVRNFRPSKIKIVDFILQPSAFWRRSVFEVIGPLNEGYHYVFDWDYWIRISEKYELTLSNAILSCNRVYGETKTSSGGNERENEIVALLKHYDSYNQKSIEINNLGHGNAGL